jgi:hypothetical protein
VPHVSLCEIRVSGLALRSGGWTLHLVHENRSQSGIAACHHRWLLRVDEPAHEGADDDHCEQRENTHHTMLLRSGWNRYPSLDRSCGFRESRRAAIPEGMTWTAIVLILVMMVAGSKLARHSLTALAAIASIGALVWFLAVHTPEPRRGAAHASLTSRAVP